MNIKKAPYLNVFGQINGQDPVVITGSREALETLSGEISRAIASGASRRTFLHVDGVAYPLFVVLDDDCEGGMKDLPPPVRDTDGKQIRQVLSRFAESVIKMFFDPHPCNDDGSCRTRHSAVLAANGVDL